MTHLGSQVSALADGQLSPAARERALAHVAVCAECAAELASARAARRALAAAFDVPMAPELTQRLLALGATSGVARGASRRDESSRPPRSFPRDSVPLPGTGSTRRMPDDCLHGDLAARWWAPGRWLTAAAVVAVATGSLLTLGGLPDVTPDTHPAQALTVLGRAGGAGAPRPSQQDGSSVQVATTQGLARTAVAGLDPAQPVTVATGDAPVDAPDLRGPGAEARVDGWLRDHEWAPCGPLPEGYHVTALRLLPGGEGIEVDLDGGHGLMVVTQQHGRLAPHVVDAATPFEMAGASVHLLSRAPWHAVWQSGDIVVSLVAEVPSPALATVVGAHPPAPVDEGVPARIARGWAALAGTWRP